MSAKRTSGDVFILQQVPDRILSLRREVDVDQNSHRFVAGHASMFENNHVMGND
jgi:hypothetical protein